MMERLLCRYAITLHAIMLSAALSLYAMLILRRRPAGTCHIIDTSAPRAS